MVAHMQHPPPLPRYRNWYLLVLYFAIVTVLSTRQLLLDYTPGKRYHNNNSTTNRNKGCTAQASPPPPSPNSPFASATPIHALQDHNECNVHALQHNEYKVTRPSTIVPAGWLGSLARTLLHINLTVRCWFWCMLMCLQATTQVCIVYHRQHVFCMHYVYTTPPLLCTSPCPPPPPPYPTPTSPTHKHTDCVTRRHTHVDSPRPHASKHTRPHPRSLPLATIHFLRFPHTTRTQCRAGVCRCVAATQGRGAPGGPLPGVGVVVERWVCGMGSGAFLGDRGVDVSGMWKWWWMV